MSTCGSCHAEIEWAVTETGGRMPLDPVPVPDGNVVKTGQWGDSEFGPAPEVRVLRKGEAAGARLGEDPNAPRFVSHFATCPGAGKHRRR